MHNNLNLENHNAILAKSFECSTLRRVEFVKSIPPELSKREDEIQLTLTKKNASPRSKLGKIYSLLADLGQVAEPYIACGKGCSSCCKMNVTISQIEANLIAEKTGKKSKQLANSKTYNSDKFIGIPCVFLKDDSCTIYDIRPFVCKHHLWFDTSAYWYNPVHSLKVNVPMLQFSGAQNAFCDVTKKDSGGIFADIRDFFPS